jgi:hypothetical protein
MKRGRMYKYEEVEVRIEVTDVIDFIESHATNDDLSRIARSMRSASVPDKYKNRIKTINDEEKWEIMLLAMDKFSLGQIESRLGSKFDLL